MESVGRLDADLLVIGGGMAGLTVAAAAAQRGACVALVERSGALGGSAALSQGLVWTRADEADFLADDPEGDLGLFRVVRAELPAVIEWIAGLGVGLGGSHPFGVGREVDVPAFVRRVSRLVESNGGFVVYETTPTRLLVEDGRVVGASLSDRAGGEQGDVRVPATVLATGGFQASPELRRDFLFEGAEALAVRSNRHSDGGGLRLGVDVGAGLTAHTTGFYGHLIPYPMASFAEADFVPLAQYQSTHAVLVDLRGERFCDESRGDYVNNQEVARRGRALLVVDRSVRERFAGYGAGVPDDRMTAAGRAGAHLVEAGSLDELAHAVRAWGYDGDRLAHTVSAYNRLVAAGGGGPAGAVPRTGNRIPVAVPPFAAVEVQAAITATFGGLRIDLDGRVLDGGGVPIDGLYAAGADAGGFNVYGYAGGLGVGAVVARRIAAGLVPRAA